MRGVPVRATLRLVPRLELEIDAFAAARLEAEAAAQGVAEADLVRHALMYYLADLDSGRISARVTGDGSDSQHRGAPEAG